MRTIRISEEVWNEIAKRGKFGETPDDVLKGVFNIPDPQLEVPVSAPSREVIGGKSVHGNGRSAKPFLAGGFEFPHGTRFRMRVHGEYKCAQVHNGVLVVDNKGFDSVSGAVMQVTGYPVNGWDVWQCQLPGEQDWRPIDSLRRVPVRKRNRARHFAAPPSVDAFKAKLAELKAKKGEANR
jgi:hypothetical protein